MTAPLGVVPQYARRRPKAPGYVYGSVSLVLVSVLALISLNSAQPPPPTIAEFAPQALEVIDEAPSEQTSDFGSGDGGAGDGGMVMDPVIGQLVPAPTPAPIEVSRVRRCVGDPPRQIEDPQSPPCVPYWVGDNGGETSPGVTSNEIRIAVPNFESYRHPILETFFNNRFEFYGRKLKFYGVGGEACSSEGQQSEAIHVSDEIKAFASTNYNGCAGIWYYRELARRKIISAADYSAYPNEALARYAPYMWSYPMDSHSIFANIGEWTCKRLGGGNAVHAGDPALQSQSRRFGVVLDLNGDLPLSLDPLRRELKACGIEPAVERLIHTSEGDNPDYSNLALDMKVRGVTSVICLCLYGKSGMIARYATVHGYFPEWLISTFSLQDINFFLKLIWPREQLQSAFGLTFKPRQIHPDQDPARWAEAEVMGDQYGRENDSDIHRFAWHRDYRPLLLLASGIQMAGPQLTPSTFEQALHRTVFPNPEHPIMAGSVGFQGRSYSMTTDGAEFWWSNDARGPYANESSGGTICYVAGGTRHTKGNWPQGGDPFFKRPCDSGAR